MNRHFDTMVYTVIAALTFVGAMLLTDAVVGFVYDLLGGR